MKRKREKGQATLLVLLATSIFLVGALGLAIDGAQLYAHRQMAQTAADAAAQAGIMTFFNGTNNATNSPSTLVYACTASDATTPCKYAAANGFVPSTGGDTVTLEYGDSASASAAKPAGVTLSSASSDPVSWMKVTVTRNVPTSLMRFVGLTTSTTVKAVGTAAIVNVMSPVPIVVLHPSLPGSFSKNGSNDIVICGGPGRSIQVNSSSTTSINISGTSGTVNLSHAGPLDPGDCSAGTGTDFGNKGGPTSYPGTILLGSKPGQYVPHDNIIKDPLLGMAPPSQPTTNLNDSGTAPNNGYIKYCTGNGGGGYPTCSSLAGLHGCPTTMPNAGECRVYSPGHYANGIGVGGDVFALFRPGIYYIDHHGFQLTSNSVVRMAVSPDNSDNTLTTDPAHTTWTQGILIYNNAPTPVNATQDVLAIAANSGQLSGGNNFPTTDCPNGGNCLVGANGGDASSSTSYYGTLFFQNRAVATTLSHSLQGGGGLSIKGTIYLTHTAGSINLDSKYQSLDLQGTSGSTTKVQGEIIVDALSLGGTSSVYMNLNAGAYYLVRQVALVK
jgi:hypothetical protein